MGANVLTVSPGYLTVVKARARLGFQDTKASLIPFGADIPGAVEALASAAMATRLEPDEVWCAAGSGVLGRGLALAWPKARRHVVQIGRELAPKDVAGAWVHVYPQAFGQVAIMGALPCRPALRRESVELCVAMRGTGRVLFWNVAPLLKA